MPKSKDPPAKSKREDDSDSDGDNDENENGEIEESGSADGHSEPFKLGHTAKLAGFTFLTFILLSSDVFISRVMGRSGVGLVSGQYPTKKGIMVQGLLLALGVIVFEFLICKEKL